MRVQIEKDSLASCEKPYYGIWLPVCAERINVQFGNYLMEGEKTQVISQSSNKKLIKPFASACVFPLLLLVGNVKNNPCFAL